MPLKLLLVDDEPIVLHGMQNALDWKQLGNDTILLADDGVSALRLSEAQSQYI
ncbi:MAG: hypothetical protein RR482_02705 [Clostridia bacterium]